MFKSILKIAARSLRKNTFFTFINITGLAASITCCLLIALYIHHEWTYDGFHEKGNRIHRMLMEYGSGEELSQTSFTSTKLAPSFQRHFPEVESTVRMEKTIRTVRYENNFFNESSFFFADSTFFNIFSFPLRRGNPQSALMQPNKVVVTEDAAKKYFGDTDPVGKILLVGSSAVPYEVTGVAANLPSNSHIRFDFIASFSSLGTAQEQTYFNANYITYFLLKDGTSVAAFQQKIKSFMQQEAKNEGENIYINFIPEPLTKIHLYSKFESFEPNSSITFVQMLLAVAVLILLIACFTYINLATARSLDRAKEVGVRKTIGASKKQVFFQFITESGLLTIIGFVVSVFLVILLLPSFNQLTGRSLSLQVLFQPLAIILSVILLLLISLFAGSYPALVLSRFNPVSVLKGSMKKSKSGFGLQQSLVVFQFVITVFLISSTLIIKNQLKYIQEKKLGYNREFVMVIPVDFKMIEKMQAIKTEIKQVPGVKIVAAAYDAPTHIKGGYSVRKPEMPENVEIPVNANPVDEDFVPATGLEIIAGENFSRQDVIDVSQQAGDSVVYHFILNEKAVAALGWTLANAINKRLIMGARVGFVKGVIRNFNYKSLHEPIGALVLFPDSWPRVLMVKTNGNNVSQTIAMLEEKWKQVVPHRPFEFNFMDEEYNKMYFAEITLSKVLSLFSILAILLACLGLIGLSTFVAQQRVKEIGIRKVLGASVMQIAGLLSKQFLLLVILASIIALPLAWWATSGWLQDFAYRIKPGWELFLLAALAAVVITILCVSYQAIKAALANPVKSLRSE
jgi:putative ABC transport system permease protein